MDISSAALPPRQPAILPSDRAHPRFGEYMNMRAGFSAKLIEAPAFADWLRNDEAAKARDTLASHPRYSEFLRWMRENKGGGRPCPAGKQFEQIFTYWLDGGRW